MVKAKPSLSNASMILLQAKKLILSFAIIKDVNGTLMIVNINVKMDA
ncbi:hypothetical protein KVMX100_90131 [Klebsiella variicola]|nr:hypothetical protein KVMX100_90131 [Klebsiella variicola]